MAERMDIKHLLREIINPDLCQYVYMYYFPESGFNL